MTKRQVFAIGVGIAICFAAAGVVFFGPILGVVGGVVGGALGGWMIWDQQR